MSLPARTPVLVMGAGGSVGRHVLDGLLARGVPVRASARRPQAGRFPAGVPVVAADLIDPASLALAFDGVGRVFLHSNHEGVQGVIDAARAARIERVVLLSSGSVVHPSSAGNAITESHREVEEAFAAAGDPTAVPVRPLVLATNALGWSSAIRAGSSLPLYRPDALTAPIHERDVAAVAVEALLGDDPAGAGAMITGPARLTQREQVAAIAAATGRSIAVDELDRERALAHLARFMPEGDAEAVLQFLDDAAAGHSPATAAVADLLGRPAIGFDAWAADHATDFA